MRVGRPRWESVSSLNLMIEELSSLSFISDGGGLRFFTSTFVKLPFSTWVSKEVSVRKSFRGFDPVCSLDFAEGCSNS